MPGHDIIVIGASAGGVEALKILVPALPADLPAAVFVVLHVPPRGTSILPQILTRSGRLKAHHAVDGEPIVPGRMYVAPPDMHLVIRPDAVQVVRSPRENGHRPAADVLFRSAAYVYGPRVAGVVLSGSLDDGTAGLAAIKQRGGVAIVQDPGDALYPGMPSSALQDVAVDYCVPVAQIGETLKRLARDPASGNGAETMADDDMKTEIEMASFDPAAYDEQRHPGTPSGFGCPDCGGALWELREGELVRFRCRVGHAWSVESLIARQAEALEEALWVALRALEEQASLSGRLAERLKQRGRAERLVEHYDRQRDDCKRQAGVIREILLHPPDERAADTEEQESDAHAGRRPTPEP